MTSTPDTDGGVVELEPCPFCGGKNVKVFGPYGWHHRWGISHSCSSFYSGTSEMIQGFASASDAARAWNTRISPPIPVADGLVERARELLAAEVAALTPKDDARAAMIREFGWESLSWLQQAAIRAIVAALSSHLSDGRDARIRELEGALKPFAAGSADGFSVADRVYAAEVLISKSSPVEGEVK